MKKTTTTRFIKTGDSINVVDIPDGVILEELPAKVYSINFSEMFGYSLTIDRDKFELPDKIYGVTNSRINKMERLYDNRDASMGVLLTGLKGAGKSLMMKATANRMLKRGLPVLLITSAYSDQGFMSLINKIGECVVIFDEFAKVYPRNDQEGNNQQQKLLTLFDGMYSSKRILLMAENESYDIDRLYIDRPSRVLLHWEYDRLEQSVVEGYCSDNLDDASRLRDIIAIYNKALSFTFDSLMSLVSQCNILSDMPFEDVIDGLNIDLRIEEEYTILSVYADDENIIDKVKINKNKVTFNANLFREGSDARNITRDISSYEYSIDEIIDGVYTFIVENEMLGKNLIIKATKKDIRYSIAY